MSKKKILILLPILIIACFLVYTWAKIASTDSAATWKHYLGLGGFFVLVFLFFRNLDWAIMVTGIFLVVGTFNALAITVDIDTFWMRIGSLTTPPVQLKLFGIFVDKCVNCLTTGSYARTGDEIV